MNAFIWINFKVLPFIIRNSQKQFGPLFFLVQQKNPLKCSGATQKCKTLLRNN